MEEAAILNKIVNKEKEADVNRILLYGVPMWRIVRYHARLHYINSLTGYIAGAPTAKKGKPLLKLVSGFWRYLGKKNLSLFFSFNRLVNINGVYLDKFIDPVIEESDIDVGDCAIVDSRDYFGKYDRVHKTITVSNESRTVLIQVLKFFYKTITPIKFRTKIKELFNQVQKPFELPDDYIRRFYSEIGVFIAYYKYYKLWFRILKPVRVFVVFREGYFPQIAVCKKLGIPVAEFQHGITLDNTVSFAGEFDERIDPDFFLVFGDYWKGPQFGMPLDRIINIGWAYSKYLQKKNTNNVDKHGNGVLVISSPEISDAILDALKELSEAEGEYSFDIRLHPCEAYNEEQRQKLQSIPKAQVVDNKLDSAFVLPTYKYVVGENSSVIYEALSVGCKVGMLNLCGLRPAIDMPGIKENFFIINSKTDFESFMKEEHASLSSNAEFYSEFDNKVFMNFVNQIM